MDCSTARLFLQLGRPYARELEEPEAVELEAHLAHCTACHHYAMDAERLDKHLGKAIRSVEVPKGLKEHLLQRLTSEQSDRQRRWVGHAARVAALAAGVLLLIWGYQTIFGPRRPVLEAETVLRDYNIVRPDREDANLQLKQLGALACAPSFTNYAYLIGSPSLAVLPGTENSKPIRVPQFVFAHRDRQAIIYAVSRRQCQIEELETMDRGYAFNLDLWPDERNRDTVYFVLFTGKEWDWLRVPPPE